MEASTAPGRIDVGDVVGETFRIYRDNAAPLIVTAIVIFAIVGLISGLLSEAGGFLLSILAIVIRLAGQALYTGFVVKLVEDVRDGRRDFGAGELLSSATPALGALILMSILWGLGVGIGFVLLVIPGLFLLTIWAVTAPAIVVEGKGALESFGRSRELVRGQGWSVFGTLLVVWLITVVVAAVLSAIGAAIGAGGFVVGIIVASVVTAPILSLAVSVIFFRLGGGRPGGTAPAAPPGAPAV